MSTMQANALTEMYKSWTARMATGTMELPEMRTMFEEWGTLATEPPGFSFTALSLGGVPCLEAVETGMPDNGRILLCFHGGGFVCGSPELHRKMFAHMAKAVGCKAIIVDYTRTPDNPHPGIVNQCTAVYAALLDQGYDPQQIAMIGDWREGTSPPRCPSTRFAKASSLQLPASPCRPGTIWSRPVRPS